MKKIVFRSFSLVLFLIACGVLANVSAQSLSGSIGNGSVARGKATKATVVLSIPGGLHANSNRPGNEYAIPTTVRASGPGIKVGGVSYPRGSDRKFSFSDNTINVYQGRVPMSFTVTVPATFRGDSIRVNVLVKYQTCSDEVCYPPKSKEVTLTAKVI